MNFVPSLKDSEVTYITAPHAISSSSSNSQLSLPERGDDDVDGDPLDDFNLDSLPLLMPNESYAFAVTTTRLPHQTARQVGTPEVHWCLHMGEHGVATGDEVSLGSPLATGSVPRDGKCIRVQCLHNPSTAIVGEDFEVQLRITNNTSHSVSAKLLSRESSAGENCDDVWHLFHIAPSNELRGFDLIFLECIG